MRKLPRERSPATCWFLIGIFCKFWQNFSWRFHTLGPAYNKLPFTRSKMVSAGNAVIDSNVQQVRLQRILLNFSLRLFTHCTKNPMCNFQYMTRFLGTTQTLGPLCLDSDRCHPWVLKTGCFLDPSRSAEKFSPAAAAYIIVIRHVYIEHQLLLLRLERSRLHRLVVFRLKYSINVKFSFYAGFTVNLDTCNFKYEIGIFKNEI